jgi:hypothetical protein
MKTLSAFCFVCGVALGAGYYFALKTYCQPRSDGTYRELYGPLTYFRPYVIAVVSICLLTGILLWIKSRRSNVTNGGGINR